MISNKWNNLCETMYLIKSPIISEQIYLIKTIKK